MLTPFKGLGSSQKQKAGKWARRKLEGRKRRSDRKRERKRKGRRKEEKLKGLHGESWRVLVSYRAQEACTPP